MRLNNKESKGEAAISKVLTDLNVEFIREQKFDECRNVKKLPFDFYLPQWNLLIEFDGEHHFRYKGFWNAGRTTLEITQANDRKKNLFCKKNRIKLIRIPFNMVNKIERIITKEYSKGFPRNLNYSKKLVKKKQKNETQVIIGNLPVLHAVPTIPHERSCWVGAVS
jgi:very-short-patch-repair endonuclease